MQLLTLICCSVITLLASIIMPSVGMTEFIEIQFKNNDQVIWDVKQSENIASVRLQIPTPWPATSFQIMRADSPMGIYVYALNQATNNPILYGSIAVKLQIAQPYFPIFLNQDSPSGNVELVLTEFGKSNPCVLHSIQIHNLGPYIIL